jgi:hypothetical protein
MADVVNLRAMRKRASRARDEANASENRLAHGLPKHLRDRDAAQQKKAARHLDLHRIEGGDGQ